MSSLNDSTKQPSAHLELCFMKWFPTIKVVVQKKRRFRIKGRCGYSQKVGL